MCALIVRLLALHCLLAYLSFTSLQSGLSPTLHYTKTCTSELAGYHALKKKRLTCALIFSLAVYLPILLLAVAAAAAEAARGGDADAPVQLLQQWLAAVSSSSSSSSSWRGARCRCLQLSLELLQQLRGEVAHQHLLLCVCVCVCGCVWLCVVVCVCGDGCRTTHIYATHTHLRLVCGEFSHQRAQLVLRDKLPLAVVVAVENAQQGQQGFAYDGLGRRGQLGEEGGDEGGGVPERL